MWQEIAIPGLIELLLSHLNVSFVIGDFQRRVDLGLHILARIVQVNQRVIYVYMAISFGFELSLVLQF